jgi:TATA-binding protein-associated factor
VSPKLLLLKELLEECGLGADGEDELNGEEAHRVLIFAQQKSTLDLIERLVFKKHMVHLQFLRLDGSVEQRARFEIAQRFNSDPTIGALLLTTQVGGLGLNLTGADTVIFVEHDWNPMRDLQAMDRAHRLGQRRVVNVYRLVLRDTLEQQILGLQRWKTKVAATVVQQQGEERVDLLELLAPLEKKAKTESKPSEATKWLQKHGAVLVDDEQMDNDEYGQSFNVKEFTKSLDQ